MKFKTFLKMVSSVGAVGFLDRIINLFTGVLLARWLGAEGYGTYAFVMAFIVLALLPVRFGLPDWMLRQVARGRADSSAFVPITFVARVMILVGVVGVVWSLLGSTATLLLVEHASLKAALLAAVWLLPTIALVDLIDAVLRGWGKVVQAQTLTALLRSLLALVSIGILTIFWPNGNQTYIFLLIRVGVAVSLIILGYQLLVRLYHKLPHPHLTRTPLSTAEILRAGFPFMLIAGAAVILARTDVLMLGLLSDPKEAGIYNIAAQGALLVQLVLNLGNTVNAPEFAKLYTEKDKVSLEKFAIMSARVIFLIGGFIAVALAYFAQPLLEAVFGPEFAIGAPVLSILALGFATALFFGETGFMLSMTGHERDSLKILSAISCFNILLNAALIPNFGAEGAAVATIVSLNLQRFIGWLIVRKRIGISCGCIA